jgi:predicted P-loop ATPase
VRKSLGLPDKVKGKDPVEVYPKQETTSAKGKANAVELPYCGMKYEGSLDTSVKIGLGGSLQLHEFVGIVKKTSIADLKSFTTHRPSGKGHDGATRDVNTLINKLTNEIRALLQEQHHPNRSDACWNIITEMINRDFSDDEVSLVLRNYPYGPYRHYAEHNSKPEEDIRRIRQKYKRNSFEWPDDTIKKKGGRPYQNVHNVALALRSPDLDGLFAYDEMERKIKVTEPLPNIFNGHELRQHEFPYSFRDVDCIHMQAWFQTIGMADVAKDTVGSGIYLVALDRSYHPIKQYLDLLKWDGKRRLNTWLSRVVGVKPTRYHAMVGRKFLLSMIARIYRPGCKVDYMMVLVGEQGKLKSTVASILAGKWFSDNLPSLHNEKDAALHLNGKWLIEMGELAALRKQEDERIKTYLTRQTDKYRPPYGRVEIDEPRQCVFLGTNKIEFLHDETGARRYWPVHVESIDLEWLRMRRDQLFAEAKACFDKGEEWWPAVMWEEQHAKPEQAKCQETDSAWSDLLEDWLRGQGQRVRTSTIFEFGIHVENVKDIRPTDYVRLDKVMDRLGWKKHRDKHGTLYVKGVG